MFDRLTQLICQGDYQEALYEFQEEHFHLGERTYPDAGKLCVLEATLWEGLLDSVAEYGALSKACFYDYSNYEIYYMLALYYMDSNANKAYLCMEMALFYCHDESDRPIIENSLADLKNSGRVCVRNVSFMILSYNDTELIKKCIDSVEKYAPTGSYEIVVVDNDSTEAEVCEYLRDKKEKADYPFVLIESKENLGFPKGCNLGEKNCCKENDVFFLNNDAVLTPNALFFLRMGLYEDKNVGACGPMSNSASLQEVDRQHFEDVLTKEVQRQDISVEDKIRLNKALQVISDDLLKERSWHKELGIDDAIFAFNRYSARCSVPMKNPYIRCFRLTGFALLIARKALDDLLAEGYVFDELFSPGYFEDDDIGIRLARLGYRQYLCKNSFVYHNGGSGFEGHEDAMEAGRSKFAGKWGFDIWNYSMPWSETCEKILELARENNGILRVIDFTCDFGANASYLKGICPDIYVAGVCSNPFAAGIAARIADDVIFGDLNCIRIPWPEHSFDVVIAEKKDVSKGQIGRCLKNGGISFEF